MRLQPPYLLRRLVARIADRSSALAVRRALIPVARARAKRQPVASDAATVVSVNWNTIEQAKVFVRAVARRSPSGTRIVIVDNGSRDGSGDWLSVRARAGDLELEVHRLRGNVGHGLALDLACAGVSTEFVVALDVDAFPVSDRWLEELLAPLREGKRLSGIVFHRRYVHPSMLAMRSADFFALGESFRGRGILRGVGDAHSGAFKDVGEVITETVEGRWGEDAVHRFRVTEKRGPGNIGSVYGGFVYHNFHGSGYNPKKQAEAVASWNEAVARWQAE